MTSIASIRNWARRWHAAWWAPLLLAVVSGAWGWAAWSGRAVEFRAPRHVVIALNPAYAGSCPLLAAQAQGYFLEQALKVDFIDQTSGRASLERVFDGSADLATVADLPVMFAAASGKQVRIIASLFTVEDDTGIVARKDRGIRKAADLKGKRIGVPMGSSPHFVLDIILHRVGLDSGEVQLLNYEPETLPKALLDGDVDAVAVWEPYVDQLKKKLGDNAAVFLGDLVYTGNFLLAGTRDSLDANRDALPSVLRAAVRGARFCSSQPPKAVELLRVDDATRVTFREQWPRYHFRVSLDQWLLPAFEDEARWAAANHLVAADAVPTFLAHFECSHCLWCSRVP